MPEENTPPPAAAPPAAAPPAADPDGLTADEIKSARTLYMALKDPSTANDLVENLARKAGLLDKQGDIKNDDKAEKVLGRITNKLKAKLGKDYDKFSDAVGPLLDEAMTEYLAEHSTKVESANTQKSWAGDVESFIETHELTAKIETKMQELMTDAPPNFKSGSFNSKRYLTRMYKAACEELEITPTAPKSSGRSRNDLPDLIDRPAPAIRSTKDAVAAALKGIRWTND